MNPHVLVRRGIECLSEQLLASKDRLYLVRLIVVHCNDLTVNNI